MAERTPADAGTTTAERPRGDLGRRIAARRARPGLSRQETADRAGMALSYLGHLEEHPGAAPHRGILRRLAAALETTSAEPTGGTSDLPPGREQAARTPEFTEMDADECRAPLGTHGVGRVAVTADEEPLVVPVDYGVFDGAIVFRTAEVATPAPAAGHRVAFEADRIDDALDEEAHSAPWAGSRRDLWVRVEPHTVTGRRIAV